MKRIVLRICNSLMALSISHSLKKTGDFQVSSLRSGCGEIAKECAEWVRKKVKFKSNISDGNMQNFISVLNRDNATVYGFYLGKRKGRAVKGGHQSV